MSSVVEVCPLLLPADPKRLSYAGFLTIADHSFYLRIILPANGDVHGAKIDCDQKLCNWLRGYEQLIKKRLLLCQDLPSFLIELKSILSQILASQAPPPPPPTYYTSLISEIEEVGWKRFSFIDASFQDLQVTIKDSGNREHTLSIHLPNKYPNDIPVCNVVLPHPFQPEWSSSNTLNSLVKQFEEAVHLYQLFWQNLEELDHNTWVLEPNSPSFSCKYRRVVLGSYLSIQITINPLRPQLLPEYILLGPPHDVAPLKERLYSQGQYWDNKCTVLTNLQSILSVEFPSPVSTKKEDYLMECGICYTHRHFETERAPEITCDNEHCAQTYHQSCLHEWLISLTTTRKNFNLLFGECIYCNQGITIPFNN